MSTPVVIDARAAVRGQIGGVERVAREMVARLPPLAPGRYRVAAPPRALAHRAGHAWEQAWLPLAAARAEVLYCPANLAPLASRRTAVLIHDAAGMTYPEWYSPAYVRWQRAVLPRVARRARLVLCPSRFSAEEVARATGIEQSSIEVVPNGVDARFSPDADAGAARAALGLGRDYALLVGTRIARKNVGALASTAEALAAQDLDLVAAGSGRHYMKTDAQAPVRALGYVPERLLPGLYAGARALVMPSLHEGFGLPCLEAMASGTPVVASRLGALPETCGDAALLVDPGDPGQVSRAVLEAALEPATRERLVAAGLERARAFSWERSARQTDAALADLL
ncbi:MAG TPA: glycosyltransferase family 1 protein [Thermoleophilaceae bacterium]|nr:glycosyltransferase family 1 protein [Thermoleophilaceae bacterium]